MEQRDKPKRREVHARLKRHDSAHGERVEHVTLGDLRLLAECLGKGLHKMAVETAKPHVPYGVWHCRDGRQVIFNRSYEPLWERLPSEGVKPADANEWIEKERTEFFFDLDDIETAYLDYQGMKRLRALLVQWGCIRGNKRERSRRWYEFIARLERWKASRKPRP